jgi:hypothetical protein
VASVYSVVICVVYDSQIEQRAPAGVQIGPGTGTRLLIPIQAACWAKPRAALFAQRLHGDAKLDILADRLTQVKDMFIVYVEVFSLGFARGMRYPAWRGWEVFLLDLQMDGLFV